MIQLFIYEMCPFCDKVRHYMDMKKLKEGKDFILVDAKSLSGTKELLKIGGKQQVPFLVDGAKSMYESDDIITYLNDKYSP